MSFLLKIVEGPNRGAEIALVDGVQVSLGKGDDCDIVLADPTLPEAPVSIEAHDDGVTIDGEALAPFAVKTLGATSLAVGPADAPWGPLAWPEKEQESPKDEGGKAEETDAAPAAPQAAPAAPAAPEAPGKPRKRRTGCLVAAAAALLLLLVGAGLAWLFRGASGHAGAPGGADDILQPGRSDLSGIASRYGLSLAETNGTATLSGNLATRRERLAATTEAYAANPGIVLDLSDDESFRTSAEDALFTLTEGALKVMAATNRHLRISGSASSPTTLTKTLEALAEDLPKLRSFDVTGVVLDTVPVIAAAQPSARHAEAASKAARPPATPSLPVCGIMTVPYPCVVLRDGRRLMEGATLGDSIILKIEPDSVTLTNSTGRIAWKP